MGKVITSAATPPPEMKGTKKKGRPPKNSIPPKDLTPNSTNRRSSRRNPNSSDSSPPSPEINEDDEEDERKEKKVKLVVRLPQSDDDVKLSEEHHHHPSKRHFPDSGSGSGSDPDSEDGNEFPMKRRIMGSEDVDMNHDKEVEKATDSPIHGSPMDFGSATPLPDKKFLVFILDRLQKKDVYGVFSEPVDPKELPDYFDIIKQPMDFGTVRKKLNNGVYKKLEELEVDVSLICSNAMQYNASDTVYYRQARSIQELARRDFANLKHEGEDGAPQPKIVRRGRPPNSKNAMKSIETSPMDHRLAPELSSGATLANEEKSTQSTPPFIGTPANLPNLRKGTLASRLRSAESVVSANRPRYGDSEWSASWNTEFPASILRADMKYGSKHFAMDENRRDTYTNLGDGLSNGGVDMRRLVPVGLHEALGYARSLARYSATLGPVAWRIASKKIEAVLPSGVQYGPGWVGDNAPPQLHQLSFSSELQKSSDTVDGDGSSSMHPSEAGRKHNSSQNQLLHSPYRNGSYGELKPSSKDLMQRRSGLVSAELNLSGSGVKKPDLALQL